MVARAEGFADDGTLVGVGKLEMAAEGKMYCICASGQQCCHRDSLAL
jgi:hypothetical protein